MRSIIIGALFLSVLVYPFSSVSAAGVVLDNAAKHAVIQQLNQELADRYVFPERATRATQALTAAEKSGTFNSLNDPDAFARAVTATLAQTLHDKHLHLNYSRDLLPAEESPGVPTPAQLADMRNEMAYGNFGLAKAIRLRGNVGYLDVRGFPPAEMMGPALASAMEFLSNTGSLIIDLRKNGGGSPGGVALLCSYLFPAGDKIHINDIYTRTAKTAEGKTKEYWTASVPMPPYSGRKVYVLTSRRTFSGGEEFAYDMQTQKRATLVGEITGGGANPGDDVRLNDHFEAFVPTGRAINPITHTNWEGVGVKPDVSTTADGALPAAYLALLRQTRDAEKNADRRQALSSLIDEVTKSPGAILIQ